MSHRYYKSNRHGHGLADDEDSDIEDFEDLDLEDFRSVSGGRSGRRESTRSLRGGRRRKNSTQSSFDFEDEESEEMRSSRGMANRSSRGASLARSIAKKERDLIRNDPRTSVKRDSFDSPMSISESDREKRFTAKSGLNGHPNDTEESTIVKEILEETQKILVKDKVAKSKPKQMPTESLKPIKAEIKKKEPSPPPSPPKVEIVKIEVEVVEELVTESDEEEEEAEEEEEEEDVASEEEESEEEEPVVVIETKKAVEVAVPPKQSATEHVKESTTVIDDIDEALLGPPPEAPIHEWECEYCTYVNEPNTKICSICCKTPSSKPLKLIIQKQDTPSPPREAQIAPKQIETPKETLANGDSAASQSKPPPVQVEKVSSTSKKIVSSLKSSKSTDANDAKKGRLRKISFWPGLTKPTSH